MTRDAPDRYIATMSKAKRRGKIFVDYLRNQRGATAIASYSTRRRDGAPVATPLAWDELTAKTRPDMFNIKNLPKRLEKLKKDPGPISSKFANRSRRKSKRRSNESMDRSPHAARVAC